MDSIEKCIVERALHEQEIKNRLRRLNNRNLQIQECKVQEVKTADASSRDTYSSRFLSDIGNANNSENDCNKTGNAQSLEKQSSTYGNESNRSRNECSERRNFRDDTNIRPSYDTEPMVEVSYNAEYNVFAVETQHTEEPEFVNDSYMMEKESNDIRDRCRSALHQQKIELEKYKVYKICQLGKEEKNAELVYPSSLERIRYDLLRKEKEQLQKDFKISQDKDIDKLIALENQVKFLNDIVYKTNQSVQTIYMLAPNTSSYYNVIVSFVNPKYLKKAQSKKLCLYKVPYDKDDLANIFAPNTEETFLLE
ncbi:hypothetical protein Tco_0865989 [Tanacetum coccineum]